MEHKVIHIPDKYLLVVDNKRATEFKGFYYVPNEDRVANFIYPHNENLHKVFEAYKILAHLPINGSPELSGVDWLPELPEEDCTAEKLAKEYCKHTQTELLASGQYDGFVEGYKAASQKRYTEEDILLWYKYVKTHTVEEAFAYLHSLSTPKIPIGFEFEMDTSRIPYGDDDWKTIETGIKTIPNEQGISVAQGTWVY